jgi:hypothetical protein
MQLISLVIRAFHKIQKRISLLTLAKRRSPTLSKQEAVVTRKGKQPECVKAIFEYFENGNVSEDE